MIRIPQWNITIAYSFTETARSQAAKAVLDDNLVSAMTPMKTAYNPFRDFEQQQDMSVNSSSRVMQGKH